MGWTSPAFLPALLGTKEGSMSLKLLAIDLGKRSFHCHGIDSDGVVVFAQSQPLQTDRDDQGTRSGSRRHGGLRQLTFLGPELSGRWASSFADQFSFREAFRQGVQERCR